MARAKTERWRKVAGRHVVRLSNVDRKTKSIFGPGQPDGDIVEFPVGFGPSPNDASWLRLTPEEPEPAPEFKTGPEIVSKGGGWYDVINPETGEPINEASLRKEEAEELAAGWKVPEKEEEGDDDDDDGDDD